jgi:hypothetical protein
LGRMANIFLKRRIMNQRPGCSGELSVVRGSVVVKLLLGAGSTWDSVVGNGFARARDVSNLSSQRRVKHRKTANRRRRWPLRKARNQNARLGGPDKSTAVGRGACGWFYSVLSAALNLTKTALWEGTPGKPSENAPSLRQKPEILRPIQGCFAFSLPDRW